MRRAAPIRNSFASSRRSTESRAPMDREQSRRADERRYRIGVDIGGTFTDFVLLDTVSGRLDGFKLLTTVDDPSVAVFQGLEQIAQRLEVRPADVAVIVHAT